MVAGDGVEPPKIQVLSLVNYPLFYPATEKDGRSLPSMLSIVDSGQPVNPLNVLCEHAQTP